MTQSMVDDVYRRMFSDSSQSFDLYEGTASSAAGTKIIYLSTDLIVGIHKAIEYEAGEAWQVIFNSCGLRWGRKVATSFERELRVAANRRIDALTVIEYKEMVESYFSHHGWGKLSMRMDGIESHGVLVAELTDSVFRYALPNVDTCVDQLIAGMLRGIFESLAQAELDCLMIEERQAGSAPLCRFLISGPDRIRWGQSLVDEGKAYDEVYKEVLAS
ncbi:MAG: hypothetical protein EAZ37_03220 [Burkholderiales bacterium]|nr:MAG: hypothetical protein EAZ37_03220 [Burkholderiales bacterium]